MAWFLRDKDAYMAEREAWGNLGFSVVQEKIDESFEIEFKGNITYEEKEYEFSITYPSGYPYLAPTVKCLSVKDQAHQSPSDYQTVCWHEEWRNYGILKAENIYPRLKRWVEGINQGFKPEEESDDVTPTYYEYSSKIDAVLITPEELMNKKVDNCSPFSMNLRFNNGTIQAELKAIKSEGVTAFSSHDIFGDGDVYKGLAVTIDEEPPFIEDKEKWVKWIEEKCGMKNLEDMAKLMSEKNPDLGALLGVSYPRNGKRHFLVITIEDFAWSENDTYAKVFQTVVFKSQRISKEHLFTRVSHLQPLQDKHVAIVGVGAVGSPIALELAKTGVGKLTLVDYERLEVGNIVRHVANFDQLGLYKVEAVEQICEKHNPYIKVNKVVAWWGYSKEANVTEALKGVDLVICCVGHSPSERYVDDITRRLGIPTIYSYSGLGAISGRIFSVNPKEEGPCYHCHQYAIGDKRVPAIRHAQEQVAIHEDGCASPAYLGSSIDTVTLAAHTSRLALQTLLQDHPQAYEPATHNHIVWHSQDGNGQMAAVHTHIQAEEKCSYCEVKKDVYLTDIVPEAKVLVQRAVDVEEAGMNGGRNKKETKRFHEEEKRFIGERYQDRKGTKVEIEKVHLNENDGHKNWDVQYRTEEGKVENLSIDDFFGYEFEEGCLLPRYEKISS